MADTCCLAAQCRVLSVAGDLRGTIHINNDSQNGGGATVELSSSLLPLTVLAYHWLVGDAAGAISVTVSKHLLDAHAAVASSRCMMM